MLDFLCLFLNSYKVEEHSFSLFVRDLIKETVKYMRGQSSYDATASRKIYFPTLPQLLLDQPTIQQKKQLQKILQTNAENIQEITQRDFHHVLSPSMESVKVSNLCQQMNHDVISFIFCDQDLKLRLLQLYNIMTTPVNSTSTAYIVNQHFSSTHNLLLTVFTGKVILAALQGIVLIIINIQK